MSRLANANNLAEILASIVGDVAFETRTQVIEEGWTGKPSRDFHNVPTTAKPEAHRNPANEIDL